MGFSFSKNNIKENRVVFIYEDSEYSGVRKIAGAVREDIAKVFGAKPIGVEYVNFADTAGFFSYPVFFGTVGKSAVIDKMSEAGLIDLFPIAKERERFSFNVLESPVIDGFEFEAAIVIAGSDKRGTIYGLFELSRMLGVSPFTDWLDVKPPVLSEFTFNADDSFTSAKPSVKYRGFFINDEWPAFGNWCEKNFGGFNAKAYEKIFSLLLRMKGNYLWPAMWSARFYDDGPKDANAQLADELGIIMGTSHHEPCMRQGEEYKYLRGEGSKYGDAWDFKSNREGITAFWEDSLNERCRYENVITLGMRGECDTPIMEDGAGMEENIALLRDVIKAQNGLIEKATKKPVSESERLIVLYKEVEPFFYGDGKTKGLMDDPALDGVITVLSDDNHGNLRTVPDEKMLGHKGGFGLYYHLDYHGTPVSFEWFNTSYLPKIWEQMTMAYDCGIRELWIANAGDIFTNEYPLSFFMDMAFDFERWGTSNRNSAKDYTAYFVKSNFPAMPDEWRRDVCSLLTGYTKITSMRYTEAMNDGVYAPFSYGESKMMLDRVNELIEKAALMYKEADDAISFPFYELVYLPLTATLNIQKMWLLTGLNHAYAGIGSTYANALAQKIGDCIKKDRKLVDKLHGIHKGKWYGMGMSEHIGFIHWCEEECRYPVVHTFEPPQKPRLIVSIPTTGEHTEGGFWSGKVLTVPDMLDPLSCGGYIEISTAGSKKVPYRLYSEDDFIDIIDPGKNIKCEELARIFIFADRMKLCGDEYRTGHVYVEYEGGKIEIQIPVYNPKGIENLSENTFMYLGDNGYMEYVSIEAEHFSKKSDKDTGAFEVIEGYGKTLSAVKAYPQNVTFTTDAAPTVTYAVLMKKAGRYNVRIFANPSNPPYSDNTLRFGIALGDAPLLAVDLIPEGYEIGDHKEIWEQGILDNIRCADVTLEFMQGINEIRIGALSPGFVLEKIVITPEGRDIPESYLGPSETFHS